MCFYGAVNHLGCGIRVIFISLTGTLILIAVRLQLPCTNNIAKYEACIIGLKAAIDLGIDELEVYGESTLVIFQATGDQVIREKFLNYLECLQILSKSFEYLTFDYISRRRNSFVDALATLASIIDIPQGAEMTLIEIEQRVELAYYLQVATNDIDREPWFLGIKNYLKDQALPSMAFKNDECTLWRLVAQFISHGGTLYKKSPHHVLLRCVDEAEASIIIEYIYGGECGPHMNGLMLAKKIL